jgi:nucleoside-diphosphate-sugar epimerase
VDDVVAVMRLVADQPEANGRTYIVAEPRAYSGRELSEAIRSISPTPKFSWSAPACCFRFGGKLGDIAGAISSRRMPVNSEVVSRLLDSACYSPALIEHELGWRAKVGLVDGLREMLTPVRQRQ